MDERSLLVGLDRELSTLEALTSTSSEALESAETEGDKKSDALLLVLCSVYKECEFTAVLVDSW